MTQKDFIYFPHLHYNFCYDFSKHFLIQTRRDKYDEIVLITSRQGTRHIHSRFPIVFPQNL